MSSRLWDQQAASFDEEPDHGLTDPVTRAAWRDLLVDHLPSAPARVADLGCGTGTLTRLLVDEGYRVDGVDFSPLMIEKARTKVPEAHFQVADVSLPPMTRGGYDAVLCRHVLWALPDPAEVLARWIDLLTPTGVLVLVEGAWHTGGGLSVARSRALVGATGRTVEIRPMPEPEFWGGEITDERYLLLSGPAPERG